MRRSNTRFKIRRVGFNFSMGMLLSVSLPACANDTPPEPEETPGCVPDAALRRLFAAPPNEYRIVQYGHPSASQIDVYRRYGIGGIMAFFNAYLRDPSHRQHKDPAAIRPMLDLAKTNGMPVWLADDFGYPSGMAGGQVVARHPEYETRGLLRLTRDGRGPVPVEWELPGDMERVVAAAIYPVEKGAPQPTRGRTIPVTDPRKVTTAGLDGDWRLAVFARKVRDRDTQAQSTMAQFGHTGRYPDLMNPRVVKLFIALMHERLAGAVGDLSGLARGFYSNEPNLMQLPWDWNDKKRRPHGTLPWNDELPGVFARMHGYDLMPHLDRLFEGDDPEARRVRMHFHQTVAALVTDSYSRQLAAWCETQGLLSSGHCLLEERLPMHVACYGDMMKFASAFHVPAFDMGIPNEDRIGNFPYRHAKFFSGVAAWKNRDTVICLPDPIIEGGGHKRLSPAIPLVRNVINMTFLYGGNLITSYMPLYAREDAGGKAAGYTAEEYRALNEYVGRLALLLRGARQETAVALYYPIAMFQADYKPSGQLWSGAVTAYADRQRAWDRVESALLDAGMDYTILHPEALRAARIEQGVLKAGRGAYLYLVMPRVEILSLAELEQIRRFEARGGVTLWVDTTPSMGAYAREDSAVAGAFARTKPIRAEEVAARISTPYDPRFRLDFETGAQPISVARFRRGNTGVYYLVNRGMTPATVVARATTPVVVEVFDPATGRVAAAPPPARVELPGLGSVALAHPL